MVKGPNQSNVDTLNSVRHEANRHFRNKKKEYLKAKIDELETNGKIKKFSMVFWQGEGTINLSY